MTSLYTPTVNTPFSFQVSVGDGAAPPPTSLGLVTGTSSLSPLVPVCLPAVQPLWLRMELEQARGLI